VVVTSRPSEALIGRGDSNCHYRSLLALAGPIRSESGAPGLMNSESVNPIRRILSAVKTTMISSPGMKTLSTSGHEGMPGNDPHRAGLEVQTKGYFGTHGEPGE
jgi:hypothetical protein